MAISRRSPFQMLRELEDRLSDMVPSQEEEEGAGLSLTRWRPRVDVYEEGNNIVFECEAPGLSKDQLNISLEENRLNISGQRSPAEENRNYLRSERVFGEFKRSFSLPDSVDRENISANYDNGILTVRLPKKKEAQKQSISIS